MQLTRAADYGVRVMVTLAGLPEGGRVSLLGLTGATGAPESFLSKVMQSLARAGLINSRRGIGGGFEMSATGRAASMRTVIEAIDGPIVLNVCLSEAKSCKRLGTCPANPVWVRAQRAMLDVLDGALIRELAKHESRMHVSECFGSLRGIQLRAIAAVGEAGSAGMVSSF
jgi:Rrf2 family transcriptional regulator, iron-sulfur cluster assembly transcription factor